MNNEGGEAASSKNNLWSKIRAEVQTREDLHDANLILLGDKGVGKRSILREINKQYVKGKNKAITLDAMGSDFAALDNFFMYVKDLSDQDNINTMIGQADGVSKLNVWSISDDSKWDLLEAVLKPQDLQNTCAVIVLDFDKPWEIMNSL